MGVRGELFTTQVVLDNRSYFFNVKENRTGDVFLQVVESKSRNGEDYDRHAICIFAEDMQKFFNYPIKEDWQRFPTAKSLIPVCICSCQMSV